MPGRLLHRAPMDARLGFRLQMANARSTGRAISWLFSQSHRLPSVPGDDRVRVVRDVRYGRHARQGLDVYLPVRRPDPVPPPWLMFVHGGGYIVGDRRMGAVVGRWLAARGIAVVAPGYRLQPDVTLREQLGDIAAAIEEALTLAQTRFELDRARYVLGGESAGAHLSLRALQAYNTRLPAPRGWLGLYGLYDMTPLHEGVPPAMKFILRALARGRGLHETSLEHTAHRPLDLKVPMLLLHGESDAIFGVDQSRRLHRNLCGHGHDVRLQTFPQASHGFLYDPRPSMRPHADTALRAVYSFVRRCTVLSPVAERSRDDGRHLRRA